MTVLKIQTTNLNVIQIYAPTTENKAEKVEDLIEEVEATKNREGFDLGVRDERDYRLIQLCQEKDLMITNIFSKLSKCALLRDLHIFVWDPEGESLGKIGRLRCFCRM